jgi:hypothetical protein
MSGNEPDRQDTNVIQAEVAHALELGIDRNEIVLAANLHPVASIEEEREVGPSSMSVSH